ncbi:DUF2207 domain-containing protein [Candidatus Saccharibacteria bacterium]|nr:DUF2207 domain-containing protein [Candidatus Saccharibacteria bacterium]
MLTALSLGAVTMEVMGAKLLLEQWLLFLAIALFVISPLAFFKRWFFYRRRLKRQPITAEYVSPLDLNPAEMSYLFDGKLHDREVGATIIHMIQRGLLHLKKMDNGKRIFAGPRIEADLKSYEKKFVEEADTAEGIEASALLKRFASLKTKDVGMVAASKQLVFTQLVHSDLQRRQFVKNNSTPRFLIGVVKVILFMFAILIFLPILSLWGVSAISAGTTDLERLLSFAKLALVLSGILALPFFGIAALIYIQRGRIVGCDWIITEKLGRQWSQIIGFRQYVQLVENEKLEFQSEELKKRSKNDTLPYAVALGFVKNWRDLLS